MFNYKISSILSSFIFSVGGKNVQSSRRNISGEETTWRSHVNSAIIIYNSQFQVADI